MTPGYSVRRLRWQSPRGDATFPSPARGMYHRRRPGAAVVARFPDYAAAADALERERAIWLAPGFNPFAYGGPLPLLSSLPEPIFRDWLLDRGHEPPARGHQWGAWLAKTGADPWAVREGLDKLRFYDVAPARPPAYVVMERAWMQFGPRGLMALPDSGRPVGVYADRAAADRACRGRDAEAREAAGGDAEAIGTEYFEVGRAVGRADAADYYAVVEVEGAAAPAPPVGWLVVRRRRHNWAEGVPLTSRGGPAVEPAAFAPGREAAEGFAAELERQARATLNPFACYDLRVEDTVVQRFAEVAAELRGPDVRGRTYYHVPSRLVAWYDRRAHLLTSAERARLWDCFPGPVYAVEEVACG